jgi:ribonuclease HI
MRAFADVGVAAGRYVIKHVDATTRANYNLGFDMSNRCILESDPIMCDLFNINTVLKCIGTKSNTSPDIYLSRYRELVSMYQGYQQIFTDGSKHRSAVSAGAVTEGKVLALRLPDHSSIFSAEARAVLVGLKIIEQSPEKCFLILSDSLSCLKSVENRNLQNPVVLEIIERVHKLLSSGLKISFVWVPSSGVRRICNRGGQTTEGRRPESRREAPRGWGLGRGGVWGSGGSAPRKFLKIHMKICALWCIWLRQIRLILPHELRLKRNRHYICRYCIG